jgi:hypothetical protein
MHSISGTRQLARCPAAGPRQHDTGNDRTPSFAHAAERHRLGRLVEAGPSAISYALRRTAAVANPYAIAWTSTALYRRVPLPREGC